MAKQLRNVVLLTVKDHSRLKKALADLLLWKMNYFTELWIISLSWMISSVTIHVNDSWKLITISCFHNISINISSYTVSNLQILAAWQFPWVKEVSRAVIRTLWGAQKSPAQYRVEIVQWVSIQNIFVTTGESVKALLKLMGSSITDSSVVIANKTQLHQMRHIPFFTKENIYKWADVDAGSLHSAPGDCLVEMV